jgi:hypothetical protein
MTAIEEVRISVAMAERAHLFHLMIALRAGAAKEDLPRGPPLLHITNKATTVCRDRIINLNHMSLRELHMSKSSSEKGWR